jgi:uncharacterized protein YoxC
MTLPLPGAPALALLSADTVVAYTLPVRDGLAWASDVLALLLLLGGGLFVTALIWLIVRISRVLEQIGAAVEQVSRALLPVVAEAEGIVADTRATVGVVRADAEVLSGSVAALGEDVRHAAALAGERVARLNAALETLQVEFEGSVRATVRLLRTVRGGAQLLRRLLGARRRRRRSAPERDARGQDR